MNELVDADPLHDSDAALKPILQAAQESSSSGAGNFSTLLALVSKALSHADVFAGYDQLKSILQEPLRKTAPDSDKAEKILQTLDLFSHGTYADYVARDGDTRFLTLSDSQIYKLRQLTILSLVQTACLQKSDHLSYAMVQQALQLENAAAPDSSSSSSNTTFTLSPGALATQKYRAVEQLLISCVYAGVVSGRLCQKTQSLRFVVTAGRGSSCCFVARDVTSPQSVPQMLHTVRQLRARLRHAQQYLTRAEQQVQQARQQDELYWKQVSQQQRNSAAADLSSLRGGPSLVGAAADTWSAALVGHAGLLTGGGGASSTTTTTDQVTSAAAAMDVTGRRQNKRSRGGAASAFQI